MPCRADVSFMIDLILRSPLSLSLELFHERPFREWFVAPSAEWILPRTFDGGWSERGDDDDDEGDCNRSRNRPAWVSFFFFSSIELDEMGDLGVLSPLLSKSSIDTELGREPSSQFNSAFSRSLRWIFTTVKRHANLIRLIHSFLECCSHWASPGYCSGSVASPIRVDEFLKM